METIVVYSAHSSNRLTFVLDWLFKERLQLSYRIVGTESELQNLPFYIAYGLPSGTGISVPDCGLLWQQGIQDNTITSDLWKDLPVLFSNDAPGYTLPFDLFSALFYLLSRYEEYNHFTPDKHGRYPATSSILFKNGWLQRPIVDEWIHEFRKELNTIARLQIPGAHFSYQPSYDIDMAYSHLHKGYRRIVGAYVRALIKMDLGQISERTQVLKKKQKDPYDSFRWLRQLHKEYDVKPIYFILAAFKTTSFDKNIPPTHPAMVRVIKNIARDGAIGIHPSYYSNVAEILNKEKKAVEQVSSRSINLSRQHYIRIQTPATYRLLIKSSISDDYSMGYGAHLGFRAGTGKSFLWYDIGEEKITGLRLHPFCFMDTTAHFEAKLSPSDAIRQLESMTRILERTGSTLVTIFHNFSLGTDAEWKGWRNAYETFVSDITRRHTIQ